MRTLAIAISITSASVCVGALATEPSSQSMGQDLAATIALQGLPCDKVVSSKRNSDSDYIATCQDGHRYHIFVDPRGRVVVQKL